MVDQRGQRGDRLPEPFFGPEIAHELHHLPHQEEAVPRPRVLARGGEALADRGKARGGERAEDRLERRRPGGRHQPSRGRNSSRMAVNASGASM
ncbi:MAG: hypothetical protein DMD43_06555 [Gemmatimonadetes bacterium]|nr:MAG: hypothetical protein DMD43_06555 [Gemmatimonadota bacterium]